MWLPLKDIQLSNSEDVLVVSFVGSTNDGFAPKSTVLNTITETQLFTPLSSCSGMGKVLEQLRKQTKFLIEAQYDAEKKTLYLSPVSPLDAVSLHSTCSQTSQEDYHASLENLEEENLKYLLFLFMVSHVVVILHPTPSVNLHWHPILRVLQQRKLNLSKKNISDFDLLSPPNCIPRLLFLFQNDGVMEHIGPLESQIRDVFTSVLLHERSRLFFIPSYHFAFFYNAPTSPLAHFSTEPSSILFEKYFSSPSSFFPKSSAVGQFVEAKRRESEDRNLFLLSLKGDSKVYDSRSDTKAFLEAVRIARSSALLCAQKALQDIHPLRYPQEVLFPSLDEWAKSSHDLFESLFSPKNTIDFHDNLNVLKRYSLMRCQSAFPQALAQYTQDLPQYYPAHIHRAHLTNAVKVFSDFACGPMFPSERSRLIQECEKLWVNGRQSCEARSVTGRLCVLPRHEGEASETRAQHKTDSDILCSCTCGASQKSVNDPFHLDELNIFNVDEDCCKNAILSSTVLGLECGEIEPESNSRLFTSDSSISGLLTRTRGALDEIKSDENSLNTSFGEEPAPCWKLYFMGNGKVYSSGTGLPGKAGFIHRANFLLPWEVPVPENWSVRGNSKIWSAEKQKDPFDKDLSKSRKHAQYSRGYIGYEYECPNGHRFIAGAPGKVVKLTTSGYVKGTSSKVLNVNMPFVQPCPCNENAMAQLTKLHIITPASPFKYKLLPKLQFRESPPLVVHSGREFELEQGCTYILRLPRVFTQNGKPILLPSSPSALKQVVLLSHPIHF